MARESTCSVYFCLSRSRRACTPRGAAVLGLWRVSRALVLALVVLVHQALAEADGQSTVSHVSTFCELQRALADAAVVHVVVTGHLYFDASAKCSEAGTGIDSENISSVGCDRQERETRDRDDDQDTGDDESAPTSCNDELSSEEVSAEAITLPLLVQGARKTIRGSCKEPPPEPKSLRDTSLTDEGSTVTVADSSTSWQSPQCVIQVPSVLLHIDGAGSAFHVTGDGTASSTGEPNAAGDSSGLGGRRLLEAATQDGLSDDSAEAAAQLWLSDLLILPTGLLESQWEAAGTSAVLEFKGADVWLTRVSVIGDTATCMSCMNRALSVKDSRLYSRGGSFSQLAMGAPSPVLLLDTGTAAFHSCEFAGVHGPQDCAAMHAYSGEILLEQSTFYRTPGLPHEHQICLADGTSRVYGTSVLKTAPEGSTSEAPAAAGASEGADGSGSSSTSEGEVRVVDLESGESSTPLHGSDAQSDPPQFLTADSEFMDLVRDQAESAGMPAPLHLHTLPSSTVQQPSSDDERLSGQTILTAVLAVVLLCLLALLAVFARKQFKRARGHGDIAGKHKLQEKDITCLSTMTGVVPQGPPGSSASHALPKTSPGPCDAPSAISYGSSYVAADAHSQWPRPTHPHTCSSLTSQYNRWLRDPSQAASTGDGVHVGHVGHVGQGGSWQRSDTLPPTRDTGRGHWQRQDPRWPCTGNGLYPTHSGLSVPSQDSTVHPDIEGHPRPVACSGNLNAAGSVISQHGASYPASYPTSYPPLPPIRTKEGLVRTSVSTSPTTPLSNSVSDLHVPGRLCGGTGTNECVQMPGQPVSCIPGMHRMSQSSALLATASSGDMGFTCNTYSSMRSIHYGHAYRSPEKRKAARWNSMSQDEICDLTTMLSTRSMKKTTELLNSRRPSSGATHITPGTPDNAVLEHREGASGECAGPCAHAPGPSVAQAAAEAQRSQLNIDADLGLSDYVASGDSHACADDSGAAGAGCQHLNIDQLLEGWSGEDDASRDARAGVPAEGPSQAAFSGDAANAAHHIDADFEKGADGMHVQRGKHCKCCAKLLSTYASSAELGSQYEAEMCHACLQSTSPVDEKHGKEVNDSMRSHQQQQHRCTCGHASACTCMHAEDARERGTDPLASAYVACEGCAGCSSESVFFPLPPHAVVRVADDCVCSRSSETAEEEELPARVSRNVGAGSSELDGSRVGRVGAPRCCQEIPGCGSQLRVDGCDAVRVRDRVRDWDGKDTTRRQVLLDQVFQLGVSSHKGSRTTGPDRGERAFTEQRAPPRSFPVEPGAPRWR